jgi:opacity protein-like surface antigen
MKKSLAVVIAVAAITLAPSTAYAAAWASAQAPLNAFDGNNQVAQGYGNADVNLGSAYNGSTYRGTPVDSGFVRTAFYWYESNAAGNVEFVYGSTENTAGRGGTWGLANSSASLHSGATQVRMHIQACADRPWPVPQPCSDSLLVTRPY